MATTYKSSWYYNPEDHDWHHHCYHNLISQFDINSMYQNFWLVLFVCEDLTNIQISKQSYKQYWKKMFFQIYYF
jgi:hypothetical protein